MNAVVTSSAAIDQVRPASLLTPREIDVVRLLGDGCTYWQIAARLGVSPHTVVSHVKNSYRKLEVHTAAAAVMQALKLGLFPVGEVK